MIAIAGCGRFNFDPLVPASPDGPTTWWNPAWSQRVPITIRNPQPETLVDFTVRIRLDASRLPAGIAASDGRDLRFIDTDQQTDLPYEIETFAGTDGELWVLVPTLAPNSDHVIWLYAGNPAATAPNRAAEVWPPDAYRMVLHMATLNDSTAHGNNANDNGTTAGVGMIGPARVFDYLAQSSLLVPDAASLHPLTSFTVSSWSTHTGNSLPGMKRDTVSRAQTTGTSGDDFFLGNDQNQLYVEVATQLSDKIPIVAGTVTYKCGFTAHSSSMASWRRPTTTASRSRRRRSTVRCKTRRARSRWAATSIRPSSMSSMMTLSTVGSTRFGSKRRRVRRPGSPCSTTR